MVAPDTVEAAATADGGTLTRWRRPRQSDGVRVEWTPLRAVGLLGQLSTAWAGECPSLTFSFISFPVASGRYGYARCPVRLSYKQYFFSQRTLFLSHNKLANDTFSHNLSAKQTDGETGLKNRAHAFASMSMYEPHSSVQRVEDLGPIKRLDKGFV
jgi:hypothetical protein